MSESLNFFIKYTTLDPAEYFHLGSGTLFPYNMYVPIDSTQRFYLADNEAIDKILGGVLVVSTDGVTDLSGPDGVAALTFSKKDNFSYKIIGQEKSVTVAEEQQMLLFSELMMLGNGALTLSGELVLI